MFSQLTLKLLVVLFLVSTISFSRYQFARADDDELDVEADDDWEEGEDFDGESADPWDNTGDYKPMDDALPESVFAVIHLSQDSISQSPGLMEFIQFELPNYPTLSARDVKQSPAKLRFFTNNDAVTMYTISEALENGAVPEEQLAEVEKIDLPPREAILQMAFDEVDLTELDADEIQGILADHNVHREEIEVDDDDLDTLDDEEEVLGEDGEPVQKKPRRRKKKVDWRARRAERLKKEEAEKKEKRKEAGANGGVPGIGLAIPGPIMFLVVVGVFAGMGYLGYLLMKSQEATLDAEERKKLKSQKKIERRLKKEASKTKKKR